MASRYEIKFEYTPFSLSKIGAKKHKIIMTDEVFEPS